MLRFHPDNLPNKGDNRISICKGLMVVFSHGKSVHLRKPTSQRLHRKLKITLDKFSMKSYKGAEFTQNERTQNLRVQTQLRRWRILHTEEMVQPIEYNTLNLFEDSPWQLKVK